jgi:orotidine-5'-phosphate decarboxylase
MSPTATDRPAGRIIVALDFDTRDEALRIVDRLAGDIDFYKVGWQLFLGAGWPLLDELAARGLRVFLDLKMHDIGETVRAAIANLPASAAANIEFMTIHGNAQTVAAAVAGRQGRDRPRFLMLTALSSWNEDDLRDHLASDGPVDLEGWIEHKARAALDAGCEGLIASGESVRMLRERCAGRDFLIVTPGVRPAAAGLDDHKRSLTPYDAIRAGADYLVVGRPIAKAADPAGAAQAIAADVARALAAG